MVANDRHLGLAGESLYAESARRIAAALPQTMPSGWTAKASVQARNPIERREAETCRSQFEVDAAARHLRFEPGSSSLRPDFYPLLDNLAALAKSCPDLRITVTGHADPRNRRMRRNLQVARQRFRETEASPSSAQSPSTKATESSKATKDTPKSAKAPGKETAKAASKASQTTSAAKPSKSAKDDEPAVDLPRLRALVIVEYLLQAGVPAGPDHRRCARTFGSGTRLCELRSSLTPKHIGTLDCLAGAKASTIFRL